MVVKFFLGVLKPEDKFVFDKSTGNLYMKITVMEKVQCLRWNENWGFFVIGLINRYFTLFLQMKIFI